MDTSKLNIAFKSLSDGAVKEYQSKGAQLLLDINHWISGVTERARYLGENSMELLLDNHKNHHGFISQVLVARDSKALEKALPWVYHAYHSQGVPYDYFTAELTMWKELIVRHLDSSHAVEILPIYDWMLTVHEEVITLTEGLEKSDVLDPEHPFLKAIISGNHRAAFAYGKQSVSQWSEYENFFIEVVQPALYEVGILWEKGIITVAQEHLATAITNRVLSGLLFSLELPIPTKAPVMVTCATSEFHQIGPWMVSVALEADGWDVDYLGIETPPDAVIEMIEERNHKAVLISVTMPYNISAAEELIIKIKEHCPDVKIIVGGQAFSFLTEPHCVTDADVTVSTYAEAIAVLNDWFPGE